MNGSKDRTARPKPKRRWYQFSLATLLLVTTGVALWLGFYTDRARKQRQAVRAIEALGGHVAYRYETKPGPGDRTPPGPAWLRNVLGIDYLDHVTAAFVPGEADADLEALQGLPSLEVLFVGRDTAAYFPRKANITDAGLAHLKSVPHLEMLVVFGPNITDAGLAHLESLRQLKDLRLGGQQITDAGVVHVGRLENLTELELAGDKITDAGLAHLQPLGELTQLTLHCSITDAGMDHLTPLKKLSTLKSRGVPGDPAKEPVLKALRAATVVECADTPLRDVCAYLGACHLVKLHIDEAALKDAKIDRDIGVTYTARDVPLRTALRSMLEPLGLDWHVGQGALVITTKEAVAKRHAGVVRLQQALPNLQEVEVDW